MTTTKAKQNIPKGWQCTKLEDVAEIVMGQSPASSSYNQDGVGTPFFQGNADFTLSYKTRVRYWTNQPSKLAEPDDVLLSVRAPVGDVAVNEVRACIGRGLAAVRAKKEVTVQDFLLQLLLSLKNELNNKAQGSTFTAINGPALREIIVSLPPIDEQKKIAEILSAVDEEIQKTDEIISATEKLKRGLMQKLLFTGDQTSKIKFSDLLDLRKESFNPKTNPSEKYVGLEHIEQVTGELSGYGSSTDTESLKAKFYIGDILFGKLRPYLRKYWKAEFAGVCSTEVLVFSPKRKEDTDYLFYLVQSDKFINNSHSRSFGTRMPRTNWSIVADFEFSAPSTEERKKIGELLSAVDEKVKINRKLREKMVSLKKGLMQDLLSGKKRTI